MDFFQNSQFLNDIENFTLILKSKVYTYLYLVNSFADLPKSEDVFCEITFNKQTFRSNVKLKTQTPTWKESFNL